MTLQAARAEFPGGWRDGITIGSLTIDAGDEKAAFVFRAPKAGNIDRVAFRTATVTTGATVDVRLETVGTDGNPTGTLAGTNTNGSKVIANGDDDAWIETTLTAAAAVTRGQLLALVIVNPSVSPGNLNIARFGGEGFPYALNYTTSWQTKTSSTLPMAVRYDDTTYPRVWGAQPFATLAQTSVTTATTPDEVGNKFTVPFPCKAEGAWVAANVSNTSGDFTVRLYDGSNNVLASATIDMNQQGAELHRVVWDTEVTLAIATTYRLVILPTTTNALNYRHATWPSGLASAAPGAGAWEFTSRTDAGAWTDTADKIAMIGLLISALDDGAGGGTTQGNLGTVLRGVAH